jgi:hypothetical protein
MDERFAVNRAIIGAVIGCGIISPIVFLISESKFVIDTLLVLGTGGLIGGALCSVIFGAFGKEKGVVIGGVFGGLAGCVLASIGTIFYAAVPWPSPQPYPGVQTHLDGGVGSWGPSRIQTYTATLSLDSIQQYYEGQMNQHCIDDWKFETSSDPKSGLSCRQTECRIYRLGLEQYFRVSFCSVSDRQTEVTHIDSWQD